MKPATLFGTTLVAVALVAGSARADTVTAEGQAAIVNDDRPHAIDKATDDAKRKAVEQAVGAMISSETVTENYELISDKILSKSKGYIKKFDVISKKESRGVMIVKIKAEVSTGDLKNDLDGIMSILQAKDMPRILIMMSEQNVGAGKKSTWWAGQDQFSLDMGVVENAFINAWSQKGFEFVDRQALQGKISVGKGLAGEPNDAAVKEFAADSGAEVVVYGQAFANDVGTIMGTKLHSIRANISIRAIAVGSGRIIATATETQMAGHVDPITGGTQALEKVAEKASDTMLKRIMDKWQTEVSGPTRIKLVVKGVKKSKFAREIATFIRTEIRGVQDVKQRSYKKKIAEYEVSITGSGQTLAEELEDKEFSKFGLEIEEMTANEVVATVTK